MTRKLVGVITAGAFGIGILAGSVGTLLARDVGRGTDFTAAMAEHMSGQGMAGMTSMMNGSLMGNSMMGGPNASMGPGTMAPGSVAMPGGLYEQHHGSQAPGVSDER
jgi:hypothetical protein